MNLARIDLNLFVIFNIIYEEQNLTRTAERLHLSQPAVSHALARLREQFNDALFERAGKGMLPTPRAKALIGPVREALAKFETTLSPEMVFDAARTQRSFTLAARDIIESTALPSLMAKLTQQAPQLQLRSVRVPRRELENALISGKVDLALDVLLPVGPKIEHQQLSTEALVVVMRKNHPLAQHALSLEQYCAARHVQVSSREAGLGVEDFALTRISRARNVALRCQSYQAALRVIEQTDLLLTLPERFAQSFPALDVKPLPLALQPLELYLYWPKKAQADPGLTWLKQQVLSVFLSVH